MDHVETALGPNLAIVDAQLKVCHLVCPVETLGDPERGLAHIVTARHEPAHLMILKLVVEDGGHDDWTFGRDQNTLSNAQHALTVCVIDEFEVHWDQLDLQEVL